MKVPAEPTDTVLGLKEKVAALDAALVVERQQLLFQGKVLKDAQTVAELQYNEDLFMVCMLKKEKKATKPTAAAAASAVETSAAGTSATVAGTPLPAAAATTAPGAPAPASPPVSELEDSPWRGSPMPSSQQSDAMFTNPQAVANLQSFSGAPAADCIAALQAAMGNADLAFTFLTEGLPSS